MNALDLISYLGHSSIHPPFDAFLSGCGISWRPSMKRNVDNMHSVKGQGITISFCFDISAKEKGVKIKSEGSFIFDELYIMIIEETKKNGKYTGLLPRGILPTDSRAQIEAKLGTPTRRGKETDNYYLDELVWIVAFEGEKLQFLNLHVPDDGWRKHGLCP